MRVYNFAAGPAALPLPVLEKAQNELVEYGGCGMSVMEMSHRSDMYDEIITSARESLVRLMHIPEDFEILFLQGGATLQFAMVPMNLMHNGKSDYIVSGNFAKRAAQEARLYGDVQVVATSEDEDFTRVPPVSAESLRLDVDYVHLTTNNTVYGTSLRTTIPETGNVPIVADMSSNILSEPYDVTKFGLIYAGAQKNIGPAGVTVVIVRKDLIREPAFKQTPSILRYDVQVKNGSMYNTPPTYGIYMAKLVFEYLESLGGIEAIKKVNEKKASLLYDCLDQSDYYIPIADKDSRSIMNITFKTPSKEQDALFVSEAAKAGLVNLKGYRTVGGMRVSIYNAMTIEGVKALVTFMKDFEKNI